MLLELIWTGPTKKDVRVVIHDLSVPAVVQGGMWLSSHFSCIIFASVLIHLRNGIGGR